MVILKNHPSRPWWFDDSHYNSRRSPWLQATLSELEEKTTSMLKLIEEDADSFAQRAEMYYKKRPELINKVEDFYREHRSLAEHYDQLKLETGTRPFASHFLIGCLPQKLSKTTYKCIELSDNFDSEDSEVDDPEQEANEVDIDSEGEEVVSNEDPESEIRRLREEIKQLNEQNRLQKEELEQRNEEKREAIRQLSFALDNLKEENMILRKSLKDSRRSSSVFEFGKWKSLIPVKLLSGNPKFQTSGLAR